jgi:hypothetical protein
MKINIHPTVYEVFCTQMELQRGKDDRVDNYSKPTRKVLMFLYTPWQFWKCVKMFYHALVRKNGIYNSFKHSVILWKYSEAYLKEREWII